ncbi:MAG: gliding motility protein GldM [Schleiferiaceae bacterium]|jgi:gliding motility-associated protein GldM
MASGNLSPRQRMINMMYLVLTALLALNVSREVMDAFYEVMLDQNASIETVEGQNASLYASFKSAAADNPVKAGPWRDKAEIVHAKSDSLFNLIESMKDELILRAGGEDEENPGKPKKMDDRETAPNYFLIEKNGIALKSEMEAFREVMKWESVGNESLIEALDATFSLADEMHDGVNMSWEQQNFEHYPLISVLTFLTGMQSDVRTAEANVIDNLYSNINARDIKVTGVKPIVIPASTFVTKGDSYEAEVLLAAFDDTQNPTFVINGESIAAENIVDGVAKITLPANKVGTETWNGEIRLITNGEEKVYEIGEQFYNVAPPSVVISPTKMNVLYRGVDNPLEISVPGVDPSNLIVNGPGVKKSGREYIADVTRNSGGTMKIAVSVREADGSTKSMGSKEFRVKNLPDAAGEIFGKSEGLMSANLIKRAKVEAKFNNFDFELPLKVTSFQIIIPPFAPIDCKGNTLNSNAKAALDKAKPGTPVIIRNIKAATAKGIKPKVAPITIDLN